MSRARILLAAMLAAGCTGVEAIDGTQVKQAFARTGGLYDAPFPSEDLLNADGSVALAAFPNPDQIALVGQALNLLGRDARGFATTSGVFFQLSAGLGTPLPTMAESVSADASVYLTPCGSGPLARHPVDVAFHADGGPFGAPNLLSLLPLQGRPLQPSTLYCAVVLRKAPDANGRRLGVSLELRQLIAGVKPLGLPDEAFRRYRSALGVLKAGGVALEELAGLAVFTTDDPTAALAKVKQSILAQPVPSPAPFALTDVFADYCVYASTVSMPDYQDGTPPFSNSGGRWVFDKNGDPQLQAHRLSSLFLTVPRTPMPAGGYPLAVFVRAGGGGDRPLVDRGVQPMTGSAALVPGTGPALEFARAGFAGASVDGPLGGLRNVTGGDEQVLIFNFFNASALRDNIRESAVELVLLPQVLAAVRLDTSGCAGATSPASFDLSKLALMGHSTGASIAPLVLAFEPRYRAGLLSGAGGSFIENILYKKKPTDILPFAEVLIGYASAGRHLVAEDPVLSLVQWAAEPADPQVYARRIIDSPASGEAPRHVLMMQGIVDHYILPRIANGISLALGLDLAGTELDAVASTQLPDQTPFSAVVGWSGRGEIALPAAGNRGVTAVLTQLPEDGIEDGHETVFQTEAPKRQYRCFLQSFLAGTPRVPAPSASPGCE